MQLNANRLDRISKVRYFLLQYPSIYLHAGEISEKKFGRLASVLLLLNLLDHESICIHFELVRWVNLPMISPVV